MTRKNEGEAQSPAEKPAAGPRQRPVLAAMRKGERAKRGEELTTPDLVLLSLLAEQPMYGYQANMELKRREIWDWAEVSQPQVYYSVKKMARMGLLRKLDPCEPKARLDRDTFETTEQGREALADTLEREEWTTQRDRPAFLTWLALSWLARPGIVQKQIQLRHKFVASELKREKDTLQDVLREGGHQHHEAVWMLGLIIEHFKSELAWLDRVERELSLRAPARNPAIAGE